MSAACSLPCCVALGVMVFLPMSFPRVGTSPSPVRDPMRRFEEKGLALGVSAAQARGGVGRTVEVARQLSIRSDAVGEPFSDNDGGVHGGTLKHRHRDRGDGAPPIGFKLLGPRHRNVADGPNEDISHGEVVLRLRTPSHASARRDPSSESSNTAMSSRFLITSANAASKSALERGQIVGKQRSKGWRGREQLLIEAGCKRAGLGGHFAEAAFETFDTFGCHCGGVRDIRPW